MDLVTGLESPLLVLTSCESRYGRMEFLRLDAVNPWVNAIVFAAASSIVWVAGTRLGRHAKTISERTGTEKAFVGTVLLGGVVSLPEMASTRAPESSLGSR